LPCEAAEPVPWAAAAGELLASWESEPGRLLLVVYQEAGEHLALLVAVTASAESGQAVAGQRPKLPAKPHKAFSTTSTTTAAAVLTVMHDCACISLQVGCAIWLFLLDGRKVMSSGLCLNMNSACMESTCKFACGVLC